MEEQKSRIISLHTENSLSETIPSFLLKTYEILQNDKYNDIICWTRNGEGFIVKKVKQFAENVLPIYFRHSNYTSFVRQLNMYDFHKTRQENHENAFKNIMFKRGFKHLLKDIQRKDYKKNKENNKETISSEKIFLQKSRDYSKNQRQYQITNDISKSNINKMMQISNSIERKMLTLVDLRQLPTKQLEMLKLLDMLFEAKKLHKDLIDKLDLMSNSLVVKVERKLEEKINQISLPSIDYLVEPSQVKVECPTTDRKVTLFEYPKEERLGTTYSLFSSFNQV